jgi:type IV pilus assembly protein PilC
VPLYTYKAVSPEGRMVLGRIDAINLVDLEMRLRRMELDLVSGEPLSNRSLLPAAACRAAKSSTSASICSNWCVPACPSSKADRPARQSRTPALPRGGGQPDRIDRGWPDALAGMDSHPSVFNKVFVSLIRAGEATGRLPEVLHSLTNR